MEHRAAHPVVASGMVLTGFVVLRRLRHGTYRFRFLRPLRRDRPTHERTNFRISSRANTDDATITQYTRSLSVSGVVSNKPCRIGTYRAANCISTDATMASMKDEFVRMPMENKLLDSERQFAALNI